MMPSTMSAPVPHDMLASATLRDEFGRDQPWFNSLENTRPVRFQGCKVTEIEQGGVSMFVWMGCERIP